MYKGKKKPLTSSNSYMSRNAEDAYWPNIVSLFRFTSCAYCDFWNDYHQSTYVEPCFNKIRTQSGQCKKWGGENGFLLVKWFLLSFSQFLFFGAVILHEVLQWT